MTDQPAGCPLIPSFDTLPPLPEKVRVAVYLFTYSHLAHVDLTRYLATLTGQMAGHPRVGDLALRHSAGYPTDRCRNAALKSAADDGFHFAYFLDDDASPDLYVGKEAGAKPFLPTALDFALSQPRPVAVGAPYCAGPPGMEVVVMKNREYAPGQQPGMGVTIDKYSRDEAATKTGVEEVAALPTGGLLIDTRVTAVLAPPWFYYEFADPPFNTKLASTEDVVFTRNLSWLGVRQFVAWDCWFGHWKRLLVGKPFPSPVRQVPQAVWQAFKNGWEPELGD